MPRKPQWPPPVYQRNGKEFCRLRHAGGVRDVTLGPTGSEEARRAYRRLLAEIEVGGPRSEGPSVAVLCADFLRWAQSYHTRVIWRRYRDALRPVLALYADVPANEFGPLALRAVQQQFVQHGYTLEVCNAYVSLVRAVWKWGVAEQVLPAPVWQALTAVKDLVAGKTTAPPCKKVQPADPAHLEAILPYLPQVVADMLRLQRCTGMRPGEVRALTPAHILRPWKEVEGVPLWLADFLRHKTAHHGILRQVPLPPRAQAVLEPYLDRPPESHCFQPCEVDSRGGPSFPCKTFNRWVSRGCARAGMPPLRPNQLRHLLATEARTRFGKDAAQVILGHTSPEVTERYAESVERAARILAALG